MKITLEAIDERVAQQRRERQLLARLPSPAERRRLRKTAGISQDDVAQAVGVTREAVTRWEAGIRTPRGATLDQYLRVLARLDPSGQEPAA